MYYEQPANFNNFQAQQYPQFHGYYPQNMDMRAWNQGPHQQHQQQNHNQQRQEESSESEDEEENPELCQQFRTWLAEEGVTQKTMGTLRTNGFVSKRLFAHLNAEDIQDMQIKPKAQARLLETLVAKREGRAADTQGVGATLQDLLASIPSETPTQPPPGRERGR